MLNNMPSASDFWFLPLGGTGEIGMNVNLYGHSGQWLMVDCGVTFDAPLERKLDKEKLVQRHNSVTADMSFIESRKDALCGLVLTHAHEDHLGAVLAVWDKLQCPIYTTAFTAEVLKRKAYRARFTLDLPIVVVNSGNVLDIGPFTVEWLSTTHSIPEANALLISTPLGTVLHTGDWKIDDTPVVGERFNRKLYKQLSQENISAMVCDSTNALREGHSVSEKDCERGLGEFVSKATGRVVVTCFASNVARLITIARIADSTGRYLCLFGPALENMVSIARSTGYWPDELKITPSRHIGYLPKHEVLIVATGSQGEPRAALYKLAQNLHRDCDLDANDTVIFSSIVIPGNEKPIQKLIDLFKARDINVVQSETTDLTIHASGHPCKQDLTNLFDWVRPKCIVPVHGEPEHLQACYELAINTGVNTGMLGLNGDIYSFSPNFSIRRNAVKSGRTAI